MEVSKDMGINVELAQIHVKPGNVKDNLEKHLSIMRKSVADCVVFPELSLTGYTTRDYFFNVTPSVDSALEKLMTTVDDIDKCVVLGIPREVRKGILRNSAVVLRKGKKPLFIDKLYLANYDLFDEKRYFQEGDVKNLRTFKYKGETMGTVVCEDAWHPEPIELLTRKGADIVFVISASPFRSSMIDIRDSWRSLIIAHSLMNSVWIVFINMVGQGEEEYFWGGSMISSPSGKVVMKMDDMKEETRTFLINAEENRRARFSSGAKDHRKELHKYLYHY
ncbi:nitrilase-related carbon-nitrogen hydrolase [Sulfuracidifex tepidarius]|nr:nitrilase-related carbon-nitrogen hydrolase [Sulfuracidifex tepidarius]